MSGAEADRSKHASVGELSEDISLSDVIVHLPVGLAALARDLGERALREGIERGRVEVGRMRNAVENELGIARSVGKARMSKVARQATSRLEYPPFSIVTEATRVVARRGAEILGRFGADLMEKAGVVADVRLRPRPEVGAEPEPHAVSEENRARGIEHLRNAQRTAAGRVLKARFGGDSSANDPGVGVTSGTNRTGALRDRGISGNGGEVIQVTFDDDGSDVAMEGFEVSHDGASEASSASSEGDPLPDSLPIDDYDTLSAQQVLTRIGSLDEEDLRKLALYERRSRGRAAVLEALEKEMRRRSAKDASARGDGGEGRED